MEPGQELRSLEQAILQADTGLDLPQANAQTTFVPERRAGTVTFLFTDVEGSTRLRQAAARPAIAEVLADHQRLVRDAFARARRRGGGHAGRRLLLRLLARPRRGGGAPPTRSARCRRTPGPRTAELRVRMGLHTGEPVVSEATAITGSASTAPRGSWRPATAARSSLRRRRRRCSPTTSCPAWSSGISASSGSRTSTVPSASTSSTSRGCPTEFPPLRTGEAPTAYAGKEDELVEAAAGASRPLYRRPLVIGALAGVLAAAVAIPVFALGGGSGGQAALARVQDNAVAWSTPSPGRSSTRPPRSPRRSGWRPGRARSG